MISRHSAGHGADLGTASRWALWWGVVALTLAWGGAGGCQKNFRALHMVERSGDRAVEHGNAELAVNEFRELAERAPSMPQYRLKYAKALLATGEAGTAREQLEYAYTLLPRNEEVLTLLAEAMGKSNDTENAVRLLRTTAEDRKQPADWIRLGRFLVSVNDPDSAEAALLTAARVDTGASFGPQWELVSLYRSVGSEAKALERLRMCLYLEPDNPEVKALIRGFGEIPGPTAVRQPTEQLSIPR